MKEPLVSVIVPIYKVEEFLQRCVDSILNQTYSHYEVILVNDGSPDRCPDICDEYAGKDNRVKVIHKSNGGLSSARNRALDICIGEYVFFVDSDDAIAPNGLELLVNTAIDQEADVVISNRYIRFDKQVDLEPSSNNGNLLNCNSIDGLQTVLCYNTRWEACGSLFKRNLFKDLRFPNGKKYEDLATIPIALYNATKITFVDTSIYYYFYREGSIMHQKEGKVSMDLCSISHDLISFFKNNVLDVYALANICSGVLMELCSRTDMAANNIKNNSEFVRVSRKILRDNVGYVIKSKYYNIKQKVYYIMEAFGLHKIIYVIHNCQNYNNGDIMHE